MEHSGDRITMTPVPPTPSAPAAASPLLWGRLPSEEGQWAAFLQRRLKNYAQILFAVSAGFFSVSVLLVALHSPALALSLFGMANVQAHLVATALIVVLWALCRFGQRSNATLNALDIAATIAVCWAFTGMAIHVSASARPELVLLLTMNFVLVTRAATVPSSSPRTLAVGVVSVAPTVVVAYWLYAGVEIETLARTSAAVYAATWAAVALVTSFMISKVIYGLQRQVNEARQVGQYTLEEKIGEGGMGKVYRARHAMLRRPTAVKLLPAEFASDLAERFEREVQLTSELRHPNTVAVYDYGRTVEGTFYYAMEYLDGTDLDDLVQATGPQPIARVIHILEQVCGALREAHERGLIHRDIKPANIFLCERHGGGDVAKVLDFGLVKDVKAHEAVQITRADGIHGTPLFIAPEALTSPDRVSPSSDLYSLGGVAYFLLTGQHVFEGKTVVEVCSHHIHSEPEPPSARLSIPFPPDLDELVLRCLAKIPAQRFPDAKALGRALSALAVEKWTEEDAVRWWDTHRARLELFKRKKERRAASGETVLIDLTRRIDADEEATA